MTVTYDVRIRTQSHILCESAKDEIKLDVGPRRD